MMKHVAERLDALRPMMFDVCLRILRHPQDAEDACQEALLEAAREVDTLRDEAKLEAWARRVATTTALDFRRRLECRRAHEARALPSEPAGSGELDLQSALQALDEPERRAVAAHYLDGRPLRELAREEGVSEVAVWKRLGKAKSKLRRLLAAALPAALIAAALLFVLLPPSTARFSAPQEESWPWELPPRTWPEPVRKSWTALQTRVSLDLQNIATLDFLAKISENIGQTIHVAPGAVDPAEQISFKVQDIVADGALRLSLQPRGRAFKIKDDGTILVVKAEDVVPADDRGGSALFQEAALLDLARRQPLPPKPLAAARAVLRKVVEGPAGETTLTELLQALQERGNASLVLESQQADGRALVRGSGERLSLAAQLRRSLADLELEAVPTPDGIVLITRSARAVQLRTSSEYREQERVEAALDLPMEAGGVDSVAKLVRRLESVLRAPVRATKAAWTSAVDPKGGKVLDVLKELEAGGIRWQVREGALYLIK